MNTTVAHDLGPLGWVKGEIDQALQRCAEAGKAAVAASVAAERAQHLKAAHGHLHQAQGALAIVGLQGISHFAETLDVILANLAAAAAEADAPVLDEARLALLQQALARIGQYLDELLHGLPDQPLRLLPIYLELATLDTAGKCELAPADLFFPDLAQRPPRRDQEPAELAEAARATRWKAARLGFQRGLLKWLKAEAKGLTEMRNSLAVIEFTQTQPAARAIWWIALGFLDALALEGLPQEAATRKLCARIDAQIAKLLEGQTSVSERLLRELLYYVAISSVANEQIDCVRAAYQLHDLLPAAANAPAAALSHAQLRLMRETLERAKHEWGRVSSQIAAARASFQTLAERLAEQGRELGQLDLARLTASVHAVAQMLVQRSERTLDDSLALEVATALLLTDNALAGFDRLGVDFAHQVDVMCSRLTAVLRDESPTALAELAMPQLDEVTRQAEERLLMNQVTAEIAGSLARVEQQLDQYFRDPGANSAALTEVAKPLQQIAGAFAVLGEAAARELVMGCAQQLAEMAVLAKEGGVAEPDVFESLAHKLSALGFFVEQLRHGRADLAALLAPPQPAAAAVEAAEYVRTSLGVGEAAQKVDLTKTALYALRASPEDADLRAAVTEHLTHVRDDSSPAAALLQPPAAAALAALAAAGPELDVADVEQAATALAATDAVLAQAGPQPSDEAARLVKADAAQLDAELLAIFLEEAREVMATLAEHLPLLHPGEVGNAALPVVRRAFHTLKGSGRMVGLVDLAAAAWSVEQVLNRWLQENLAFEADLQAMLAASQNLFADWVAALTTTAQTAATVPDHQTPAVVELHERCARLLAPAAAQEAMTSLPASVPEAVAAEAGYQEGAEARALDTDEVQLGELHVSAAMLATYLAEAAEHVRVLEAGCADLQVQVPGNHLLRASHTLGGSSGALGLQPVRHLAKALEAALERLVAQQRVADADQYASLQQAIALLRQQQAALQAHQLPVDEIHALAALESLATLPPLSAIEPEPEATPACELIPEHAPERVADAASLSTAIDAETDAGTKVLPLLEEPLEPGVDEAAAGPEVALDALAERRQALRIRDDVDAQLLPIFIEEGRDLLQEIGQELRAWRQTPTDAAIGAQLQRLLHTLKGSARMCGAMRLGELVHGIESHLIQAEQRDAQADTALLDRLETDFDRVQELFDALLEPGQFAAFALDDAKAASETSPVPVSPAAPAVAPDAVVDAAAPEHRAQLRVRAELVDQLINDAGEMAIARSRIESEMRALKVSLNDLSENVSRLRQQLREIEIQAESQMQSQMTQSQEAQQEFDPLEMDRFTRFQELTRMMAEGVNDVTTVQQNLTRTIDQASLALTAQARSNRELSQSLMSVRMLPFSAIIDRLYRVVRQTAKEHGKRVNLEVRNGQLELDRSVLDKMVGAIEHLLRNAVVHGIEPPELRAAAGKAEIGEILLNLTQQSNEIIIELSDDGAGLDHARIRSKALQLGLLAENAGEIEATRLAQFIFTPGFSTAEQLTAAAGRGVGMDAVKNDTESLGGRIDVHSQTGQGMRLRIFLPLTLAVTQVLLVRSGNRSYALPSSMVEQVMELRPEAAARIREEGETRWLDARYPWHYLLRLLGETRAAPTPARRHWVLLLKGADSHIALEVDGVGGNQEVAVKNIGPQLARVPGITGATVLADGEIVLILNPLVLAEREQQALTDTQAWAEPAGQAPTLEQTTVMVVDDSLTVRKIVSRLLQREGYRVLLAKDGVDALEQLNDNVPAAMLVDIEMPRMDGFELTRNVRKDARLQDVPIIMITSRIADKHRNHALELGVNEYLGKPYDEAQLLALLRQYTAQS